MFLLNICLLKVPGQIAPTFNKLVPIQNCPNMFFLIIMIIIIIIQGLNTNYLNGSPISRDK